MFKLWLLLFTFLTIYAVEEQPPPPNPSDHAKCRMNTSSYPPPANRTISWYQVNLDLPPHDRWNEIITIFFRWFKCSNY